MSSFKDQSWGHRFQEMGDKAEAIFEATIGRGFVRTGLNRPPIQVYKLSPKIRYMPDYLCSNGFYEVQGCGKDGILKLKDEKFGALMDWHADFKTHLWVYDQTNHRWACEPMPAIATAVALQQFRSGAFPEGKAYWEIPVSWVKWQWTDAP